MTKLKTVLVASVFALGTTAAFAQAPASTSNAQTQGTTQSGAPGAGAANTPARAGNTGAMTAPSTSTPAATSNAQTQGSAQSGAPGAGAANSPNRNASGGMAAPQTSGSSSAGNAGPTASGSTGANPNSKDERKTPNN